jgi:hypothetical protein
MFLLALVITLALVGGTTRLHHLRCAVESAAGVHALVSAYGPVFSRLGSREIEIGHETAVAEHRQTPRVAASRTGALLMAWHPEEFQKLEGEATAEGLWLTPTADTVTDSFRVIALRRWGTVASRK